MSAEALPAIVDKQTPEEARASILALEAALLALPEEQKVHLEPTHHFAPGIYLRELSIPAGVTLTGAIHKTEHFCILTKGKVSVGGMEQISVLEAPAIVRSLPGVKRAIYAHQDSIWVNVHHNPTNETDLEKIWDIYTSKTFEEALGHSEPKLIREG